MAQGVDSEYYKKNKKWGALISVDGNQVFLGLFDSETEAALAYNAAALEHHGEFARLNVIVEAA